MTRIRTLVLVVATSLALATQPSYAWFFFFIPGSLFSSSDKREVADLHKKSDWSGLEKLADSKLNADPNNADWWIQKGFANLKLGNWVEAERGYKEAVRLQPSSYIAINDLGVVYQSQSRIQDALDQYLAALKVKPDYPLSMGNAAAMQYRLGHPELAWDIYQELKPIDPARAKTLKDRFLLTEIRPSTNVANTGQTTTTASAAQNQNNETDQVRKASDLWKEKNYSELVSFGESWSLANSNSPSAWYFLGLGYYGLGSKDKAIIAFKEALRLKPDLPDVMGKVLTMRGQKQSLEEVYAVLVQIDDAKAEDFKAKYLSQ